MTNIIATQRSSSGLVEKYLNSTYDTVKKTADNIELIEDAANKFESIEAIGIDVESARTEVETTKGIVNTQKDEVLAANSSIATNLTDGLTAQTAAEDAATIAQIHADLAIKGRIGYETKALMDATGAPANNELAEVWNDSILANNGVYGWNGSAWALVSESAFITTNNVTRKGLADNYNTLVNGLDISNITPVFTRGDATEDVSTINAALKGWRSPFKHDGSYFNAVTLTLRGTALNTRFGVNIENTNKDIIARGFGTCNNVSALYTIGLDRLVDDISLDDICYITYYPLDTGFGLNYPTGGNYDSSDADPSIYREEYLNNSGNWVAASPVGTYRTQFELLDISESLKDANLNNLSSDLSNLQSNVNKKINLLDWQQQISPVYKSTFSEDYAEDTIYSSRGVGFTLLEEELEKIFNSITVVASCSVPCTIRGYVVDPNAPNIYVPSTEGTQLFEVTGVNLGSTLEAVRIELDTNYTLAANTRLDILLVPDSGGTPISIPRHFENTHNSPYLIRMRLALAGVGTGIYDESWYAGSIGGNQYLATPPELNLVIPSEDPIEIPIINKPYLTVPSKIYASVDTQCNLYFDNMCSARSQGLNGMGRYSVTVKGSVGKLNSEKYSITPTSGNIGSHTLTVYLFEDNIEIESKTITLEVVNNVNPPSTSNVLMIGDSLNSSGQVTNEVNSLVNSLSGTAPVFVGTVGTAPAQYLAWGGRTLEWFTTDGDIYYRVNVSGVSAVSVGAVYQNNSVDFTVIEVDITSGAGTLLLTGVSQPSNSGTLTLQSGSGDASLTFSSMIVEEGNPLYNSNTNQLDISNFRSENSIPNVIDCVNIQLGVNDVFSATVNTVASEDLIIGHAKTLIDALLVDNANCKIIINLPTLCGNQADGFGANYGAFYTREVYEHNMNKFKLRLLTEFDDGNYNTNVLVGSVGLQIHRYYGYALSTGSAVATRISGEVIRRHLNAVHPAPEGYLQMADATLSGILNNI